VNPSMAADIRFGTSLKSLPRIDPVGNRSKSGHARLPRRDWLAAIGSEFSRGAQRTS